MSTILLENKPHLHYLQFLLIVYKIALIQVEVIFFIHYNFKKMFSTI